MKHLEEVHMTYIQHLYLAMANAVRLAVATVALGIHAVLPFLFTKTASAIIGDVYGKFPRHIRVLVRFNMKWELDLFLRKWQVVEDGVERLAHRVDVLAPCMTIEEPVNGEPKYHFQCYASSVTWNNDYVTIS